MIAVEDRPKCFVVRHFAEFMMEHGFIDAIVSRQSQKKVIAAILRMHKEGK